MSAQPLPTEPDETGRYVEVARFVREGRRRGHLRLVAADGRSLEVDDRLAEEINLAADHLAAGELGSRPAEPPLTTSQAAEILGVSRPTLVRLLDQGEIPYAQPGKHRRIRLMDVLTYREQRQRRRAALDDMVRTSTEAGLYDISEEEYARAAEELRDERHDEQGGRT